MKKLFLMAATAAVVLATGCVKTSSNSDQTRIVVKLNGASIAPETRKVESPAEETNNESPVTLSKAWVYVFSSEGVYDEEMDIMQAQADGGYVIGGAGKLFPSDSKVYVLGNWPTGLVPADLESWDDIKEEVVEITSSTSYTSPMLANATGAPLGVTVDPDDENRATVNIEISPLFSRLELWKITGGKHIVSFNVDGIYINKYFPAFTLAGAGAGEQKIYPVGTTEFNGWGDAAGWVSSTGVKVDNDVQPRAFAEAGTDASNVWAYNVGAGSQVGFIIKLSDIEYYPEKDGQPGEFADDTDTLDEKLLLVTGYSTLGGSPFARGTIYRVKNLEFDYTDLVDDITGVSITANVDVLNWSVKDVNPTLGE